MKQSMNDAILSSEDPAVQAVLRGIDLRHVKNAAARAASNLSRFNYAHVVLTPGDTTRYELSIVARGEDTGAPWLVASTFGRAYPWRGRATLHPDYATEHYADGSSWTGMLYALFLNYVAEEVAL